MSRKELKKIILISIFFSLILFCFSACRMRAEQNSLTSQFDVIDALVMQNQMQSALKELKKAEKRAYDSWTYIGIYKRYMTLGETGAAEKVLKKALKKNSNNEELQAVYAAFLLRQNRLGDAGKVSEKLRGTKYASLYSEYMLRESAEKAAAAGENGFAFYTKKEYYQIFLDAYKTSKNPVLLRNCAVFNLINGDYALAASLYPAFFLDADDAYFWALVCYDAGQYYDSIEAIENSRSLMTGYQNTVSFKTSPVLQTALESDAYMAVSEMEAAENARRGIVLNLDELKVRKSDEEYLSNIILNSARWAENQGMDEQNADLLFYVVNRWPDNVPGLILYADFAYRSNLEREEDSEIAALRKAGISTLEMERYDNRRKIPMSDALFRIDEALRRTNDPYLHIAKLDLRYKTDKSISEKDKNRDLWNMLEKSLNEDGVLKGLLVQYALNFLLQTKQYDDAWKLFYDYVTDNSQYDAKRDFWEQFIEKARGYELSIMEFGAWFAAYNKMADEALRLHEYCVYESAGLLDEGYISQSVSTASCLNLGSIYVSLGKKAKALDLYGKTAGRESSNAKRSEAFYRIACIYAGDGDIKNALRSAEYASSLYPENARASILKDKLRLTTTQ
jgi:Tfp pilus assembly protein PilF